VLLAAWGLLTALVNAHMPAGRPSLWQAARTAGGMALLGAPIMVVLFMFFPRLAPLWGMPVDAQTARTGLSNRMKVGEFAQLAQDSTVALRLKFDGPPPPAGQMYFRGPVLAKFDGIEWRPLYSNLPEAVQLGHELRTRGPVVRYEVTLQPTQRPWVMTLEATPRAPTLPGHELHLSADLRWLSDRPINDLVRYRAESQVDFSHGPLTYTLGLQDFVELPPGFNPRLMALAQRWRREALGQPQAEARLVQRALDTLRTGGYTYTLSPGTYGVHSADEFWFDRKQGFCEHMAAAFVVLMRAMDIPARIVTGYQGGELNPIDGFWTVRQSDAHAWTEVWLAGQGWVRVDPTAAVAPSRTSGLQRLEAPQGVVGQAMSNFSPALLYRLRATWDVVNNRWNQWVLNYSQDRQFDLLKNLGFESPSWRDLGYVLAGLLSATSLLAAAWTLWEHRQHDPWLRLLQRARLRAQRQGIPCGPQTTPRQLAQWLQQLGGDQTATVPLRQWLLALEALRYAPPNARATSTTPRPANLRELQRSFKALAWPTMPLPLPPATQADTAPNPSPSTP
jgi:transglutaminase-like putative cysteine protease